MPRFVACLLVACGLTPWATAQPRHDQPLTRIAFGSCADQNKACPIWKTIADSKPELLLLLGDTIYADIEDGKLKPATPEKIVKSYGELAKLDDWKALRARTPMLGTWDDHDYGHNDAGGEWEHKVAAQKAFHDFYETPADSPRRKQKGVYHAAVFGTEGKRVQVILLDGRYFRSLLKKADKPLTGTRIVPYIAIADATATMLGGRRSRHRREATQPHRAVATSHHARQPSHHRERNRAALPLPRRGRHDGADRPTRRTDEGSDGTAARSHPASEKVFRLGWPGARLEPELPHRNPAASRTGASQRVAV